MLVSSGQTEVLEQLKGEGGGVPGTGGAPGGSRGWADLSLRAPQPCRWTLPACTTSSSSRLPWGPSLPPAPQRGAQCTAPGPPRTASGSWAGPPSGCWRNWTGSGESAPWEPLQLLGKGVCGSGGEGWRARGVPHYPARPGPVPGFRLGRAARRAQGGLCNFPGASGHSAGLGRGWHRAGLPSEPRASWAPHRQRDSGRGKERRRETPVPARQVLPLERDGEGGEGEAVVLLAASGPGQAPGRAAARGDGEGRRGCTGRAAGGEVGAAPPSPRPCAPPSSSRCRWTCSGSSWSSRRSTSAR